MALASNSGLQRDLAQIAAQSALATLAPQEIERINWSFSLTRANRQVSAITLALQELAGRSPADIPNHQQEARFAAQAWERLAALTEGRHRGAALLTAAVNYDLAGYQANAICLARRADDSLVVDSFEPLRLVGLFLQRRYLMLAASVVKQVRVEPAADELDDMSIEQIAERAAMAMMADGLIIATDYFLRGSREALASAAERLRIAAEAFGSLGNGPVFSLTRAMQRGLGVVAARSTWAQLENAAPRNLRWQRYLRVLARGVGNDLLASPSISELWPSQIATLEQGLLSSDEGFAVRMPTSSGKTRVAEMVMVYSLAENPSSRCIYVAPYRALASEVKAGFENLFSDLGYATSTVPGTYEQDSLAQALVSSDQLLVLTPEKLDLLLRLQPEVLTEVRVVVVDEGHVVSDITRGPKVELLLTRLRRLVPEARFLFMSAVVPRKTLEQVSEWLGGSSDAVAVTGWRPSIQRFAMLRWINGRGTLQYSSQDVEAGGLDFVPNLVQRREFSYVNADTGRRRRPKFPDSKGQVAAELAYKYAPQGPVLIFCATTQWAESVARELMDRVRLGEYTDETVPRSFRERPTRSAAIAAEWLGDDHDVVQMLRRGIAFHHGRLPEAVREAIEYDVRNRAVEILVATSTLAQGVNLPFRTVIIHSARRYDEGLGQTSRLAARDYWNIAGRAGRAGQETEGTVIHIVQSQQDEQDFRFYEAHRGRVEPLESALFQILRDLIAERISSSEAAQKLDSDLLALLVEENDAILDTAVLDDTLASTFFAIQAADESVSTRPLMALMHRTVESIVTRVPDSSRRRIYAATGLSSQSCESIRSHVLENQLRVESILREAQSDRASMLELLIDGVVGLREMESSAPDVGGVVTPLWLWLDGMNVAEISGVLEQDSAHVTRFIEEMYAYRLPWGLAAYTRIAAHVLGIEDPNVTVENIPSMVKYGVPTPEASWAMTAGVAPRWAAIRLATRYISEVEEISPASFRRWIGQLDPDVLENEFGFTGVGLETTARAVFKSGINPYLVALDSDRDIFPMEAVVRPQRRAVDRGVVARLAVGDSLRIVRDYESTINRNAVVLYRNDDAVGYLPWTAAQAVAVEVDTGLLLQGLVTEIGPAPTETTLIRVRIDRWRAQNTEHR